MSRAGEKDQLGKGGLFEELDAAPGQFEIKARDSNGGRLALLQFRSGTVDDELVADLERWYARQYPPRTLKIVRSATGGSRGGRGGNRPAPSDQ